MGKDPDAIRQEIEETRERMGETVEAIGYKADIPSRAKDTIGEKVGQVRDTVASGVDKVTGKASRATDRVTDRVTDATPSRADLRRGGRRMVTMARENPIGLTVGAAALGFLAGLLSPSTRVEDERVGPIADQVKEKAKETGEEALRRGQHVVTQAAQSAAETAKEEGRTQSQRLAETAREQAHEVKEGARESASDQRY